MELPYYRYITISGGTLTGNTIGILATDTDPQFGAAAGPSTFTLSGITITGGTTGLQIEGTTTVSSLSGVAFSGQSGDYIKLSGSANNVDGTGATYGGVSAGSGLTDAQAFAIEDKIVHKIDNSALGFVTIKANNDYVTANSFVSPNTAADIQRGIDAASTGFTVNVAAGTYTNDLNVNKTITLKGAQSGICATSRSGSESIINGTGGIMISAGNAVVDGFTIQGQTATNYGAGNGFAIYPAPPVSGTQILNNIIKNNIVGLALTNSGANPTQMIVNCNWFDANNQPGAASGQGIYTDDGVAQGVVSNVTISNNKFSNHDAFGIDFSTGSQANAAKNITMSTNTFTGNDRAMFLFNLNNSAFTGNTVTNSVFATSGDLRVWGGVNNLTVTNNFFGPSAPHAIRITNDGGINSSNILVNNNSFSGYSASNVAIENASGYTGSLNAKCNWFGSTIPATVAAQISGNVTYVPYRSSGTDADANPANGFQPVGTCGSCNTITASATVTPSPTIAGQKVQTVFLNYPAPQTENITVTPTGGTSPYSYTWTVVTCSTTTAAPIANTASSYVFAPTAAYLCNANGGNNIYTYTATVNDAQGCPATATVTKRVNVINPYTSSLRDSVRICHKIATRGSITYQQLTVAASQAPNYTAQGDQLGTCNDPFTGRMGASQQEEEPGLTQSASGSDIRVYPNPSTGTFTVELPDGVKEGAEIMITDVQGKMVAHQQLAKDGLGKATFELTSIAKGMYLIMVKDGDTMQHVKMILQ